MSQRARLATPVVALLAAAISVAFTAALLRFILLECFFFGDDYSAFWVATQHSFAEALWIPVGAQVAPLARTLNEAFFAVFRVDYPAAVAILLAIHVFSAFALARVLSLLGCGGGAGLGWVVVALYATYVHLWSHLAWWSSGIHRMPYVALSLAALCAYLRWRDEGGRRYLLLFGALDLVALGFHVKAVLLPLFVLGVDLCRDAATPRRLWATAAARRGLAVCLALLVVNLALALLLNHLFGRAQVAELEIWSVVRFVARSLAVYGHSLLGLSIFPDQPMMLWVFAWWGALLLATAILAPHTLTIWGVLLALLIANTLVVGLSSHAGRWGEVMAYSKRYYFEIHFLTLIFLALIFRQLPWGRAPLRWLASPPMAGVAALVLVGLVGVQAAISYRATSTTALTSARAFTKNRTYVANLRRDIARLSAGGAAPTMVDGNLPRFVHGLDFRFVKHSQLLEVLGLAVEFRPRAQADYRIDAAGSVVPLR